MKNCDFEKLEAQNNRLKRKLTGCATVLADHSRKMMRYEEQLKVAKEENYKADVGSDVQLTPQELIKLNAIPLLKKCDRQFVSAALEMMYKENIHELRFRVLKKSRTRNCARTKKVTPKKRDKIYSLMQERVSKNHDPIEQVDRMQESYLSKIISYALTMAKNNSFE